MRKYTTIDCPQKIIVIDNYCENYEELCNNFPYLECLDNESRRSSAFDKSFNYNKNIWIPFIEEHISKKYLETTCDLLKDHLIEWRPKLFEKIKSGNYTLIPRKKDIDKISHEDEYDIFYDFKFGVGSNMQPSGKGTGVHVDFHNKIFQTMIYFPSFEDNGTGGDLHLTKLHQDGSFSDIVKCSYKPNRCVIFPHHPSGWHFVTPRKSKFARRGIGVVYTMRDSLQEIDSKFFAQKHK
jgi:hypothetical protein